MSCMTSVIRMVTIRKHNTYKKQHFGVHHTQSIKHRHNVYTDTIITLIKVFILSCYFLLRTNQNKINPFSYHSILTLKINYFFAEVVLKDSILLYQELFSCGKQKLQKELSQKSLCTHFHCIHPSYSSCSQKSFDKLELVFRFQK